MMAVPAMTTPAEVRTGRLLARMDGAVAAWTVAYLAWVASGVGHRGDLAPVFDLLFFTPLGLAVAGLMALAGARATHRRDRLAWYLMATAALVRLLSGLLWRGLTAAGFGASTPLVDVITVARCLVEIAALLAFVSARVEGRDRLRRWLDVGTVVIGVVSVEWYLSLEKTFAQGLGRTGLGSAGFAQYVVVFSGALCALISALLYLRRADAAVRRAAIFFMLAYGTQAVPDYLVWTGHAYSAGRLITSWWWAVWLLKGGAARWSLTAPGDAPGASPARYRSGIVPYVFLAVINITLWLEISQPPRKSSALLVLATTMVTVLLVLRHMVEQREHAALAEAQLVEQARFEALVEHSSDAVVLALPSGGASYVSPTTLRHLGNDARFSEPWGLLAALHPDDAEKVRTLLSQRLSASQSLTVRVGRAADGWRTFALRIVDLRADPRVGAIAVHGHDVTREVMLARRLHETAEVEALGVFAGGLAHDLNNVLGAISNHVELLLMDVTPASTAAHELGAIRQAVARGVHLTRALLALSRRKEPALESVDLREFLGGLVTERHLVDASGEPVRARLDRASLGNALEVVLGERGTHGGFLDVAWRCRLSRGELSPAVAGAVDLEPGTYARLDFAADDPGEATRRMSEGSPGGTEDEGLELLLARAVLREMGGALVMPRAAPGVRQLTIFVPAEVA